MKTKKNQKFIEDHFCKKMHLYKTIEYITKENFTRRSFGRDLDIPIENTRNILNSMVNQGMLKAKMFKTAWVYEITPHGLNVVKKIRELRELANERKTKL